MFWRLFLLPLILACDKTTEGPTTPPPTAPPIDKCLDSVYKAIIFLVDGSTSMGDGIFHWANGTNNMSVNWGPVYNQWPHVLPFVNSFEEVIKNKFIVVFKQFSSPDYIEQDFCKYCDPKMVQVLNPGWTHDEWQAGAAFTFTNITNGDTYTFGAVENTTKMWEQKKIKRGLEPNSRALLLLVTDGEPTKENHNNNATTAVAAIKNSTLDVFVVYPKLNKSNNQIVKLHPLVQDWNKDSVEWDFAKDKVDATLRNAVVERICNRAADARVGRGFVGK